MRMVIDDEKRIELGNYIKAIMLDIGIGFNQLSMKSKINIKPLNEILYGRQQKINPFYLQKIADALRIDYKELYRIVGYLSDDDFFEARKLKEENKELKNQLKNSDKSIVVEKNKNHGHIIVGNTTFNNDITKELPDVFTSLTEHEKERVLTFIKEFIIKK